MSSKAWVTLATNDSYGLGALVLANSLRRVNSEYPAVVLITPQVTDAMRERLNAVFSEVVTVDVLDSGDAAHLALLQRPELGITFTKIHCWNLTQFEKCVFLDADTLVVQNSDELFEREELSAAPDVGWPDCFNSGVFVFKPSAETFQRLIAFAQERGSFDGGDQGLLNSFFSDWARGNISKHLPFLYNVTSAAFYSYLPALKHFGQDLKIIHFIGAAKPWLQHFNFQSRTVEAPDHIRGLLQLWWDIFVGQVHQQLDASMVESVEVEEPPETPPPVAPPQDISQHYHYQPAIDPESEFPWHRPEAQSADEFPERNVQITDVHDPWELYRGTIPALSDQQAAENLEEIRQYAWDYQHQETHKPPEEFHFPQSLTHLSHSHSEHNPASHSEPHSYNHQRSYDQSSSSYHDPSSHNAHWHYDSSDHFHRGDHQYHYHNNTAHQTQYQEYSSQNDHSHEYHHDSFRHPQETSLNRSNDTNQHIDTLQKNTVPIQSNVQVLHVHVQSMKKRRPRRHRIDLGIVSENETLQNGDISDAKSDYFEEYIPRHPYDGYYLRHRSVIDSRGHKVCTHEIPPTPSPTPTPPDSPTPQDYDTAEETLPSDAEDHSGVAGNLARVVAGGPHEALDDLTRRQGWEAGNIDYMGADSFDKIWAKISQTLTQPRSSPSPPKEVPAPAQEAPVQAAEPVKEVASAPVEEAKEAVPVATSVIPEVLKEEPVSKSAPVSEPALVPVSKPSQVPEPVVLAKAAPEVPSKVETPAAPKAVAPIESAELADIPVTVTTEEPKKTESVALAAPTAPSVPAVPVETAKAPEVVIPTPVASESPPLASTPSKEDAPAVPAAKYEQYKERETFETQYYSTIAAARDIIDKQGSVGMAEAGSCSSASVTGSGTAVAAEERRKVGKLQLSPPLAADPLPTPDSEAEDAAALAHAIIASELRQVQTPTVTSPATPGAPASPPSAPKAGLTVAEPDVPTPPVGAVSLAQIGVKPKEKTTTAAQLESSIAAAATEKADAPKDAPKKKIIKKVVKKDKDAAAATGADAPVPPPRKKEKKPKEK